MKASSVINQLQVVLPQVTNYFSTQIPISSLTRSGSTVTAVCMAPHGLTTGDYTNIAGALTPVLIDSLTSSGKTATAITDTAHDLTENWTQNVQIIGATPSGYNGMFPLVSAINRKTFQFTLPSSLSSPASGTMYLLNNFPYGYNGWVAVTVIDAVTFTYQNTWPSADFAMGSPQCNTQVRVSGAISIERAVTSYTKQFQNQMWAFVVMGDCNSNKDRFVLTDAQVKHVKGQGFRQEVIQNFSVYVFNPSKDTVGARRNYDIMMDVSVSLFKALLGMLPDQLYVEVPQYGVGFIKHGFYAFMDAYYIHEFVFQIPYYIIDLDGVSPAMNVAFRDVDFSFTNSFDVDIISSDVNLDDEPLS